ncbi:hypothetical protein OSB94_16045 [Proteus vulgaris]|uniref:hypothetical protein n=1 Tax=Proteus vulgaris TaxID=585 RepID=UPI001FFEE712|nr:hypothetical protein [Proteus vulgaris]MDS0789609.1 hypothetical protein [Proteus vulgaris]UPK82441.1 hypothetical protein LW139_07045 [Proteus vulgaris]
MNQLDIYLNKESKGGLLSGNERFKLVFVDEVFSGKFLITEFSNGWVKYYTQMQGAEPILTNTMPYDESDSPHSRMALDIVERALK